MKFGYFVANLKLEYLRIFCANFFRLKRGLCSIIRFLQLCGKVSSSSSCSILAKSAIRDRDSCAFFAFHEKLLSAFSCTRLLMMMRRIMMSMTRMVWMMTMLARDMGLLNITWKIFFSLHFLKFSPAL